MRHGSLCKHQSQTLVPRHCLHVCISSRCQPLPSQANNIQSCGQLIEKARMTWKENWEQLRTNSTSISQVSNLNRPPFLTQMTGLHSTLAGKFSKQVLLMGGPIANMHGCLITDLEKYFGWKLLYGIICFWKRISESTEPVNTSGTYSRAWRAGPFPDSPFWLR